MELSGKSTMHIKEAARLCLASRCLPFPADLFCKFQRFLGQAGCPASHGNEEIILCGSHYSWSFMNVLFMSWINSLILSKSTTSSCLNVIKHANVIHPETATCAVFDPIHINPSSQPYLLPDAVQAIVCKRGSMGVLCPFVKISRGHFDVI